MQQNKIALSATRNPNYSEPAALQQLLINIDEAVNDDAVLDEEVCSDIQIIVGGQQVAFYLGGPQQEALYAFINHIADENAYAVDIIHNTVTQ
jgi:hypothetical protein